MTEYKNIKYNDIRKIQTKDEAKKIPENNSSISNKKPLDDLTRVEDIAKGERIKSSVKIEGADRVTRSIDRPEKLVITKFGNKYYDAGDFDPSFMQMHTSEITCELIRKELIRIKAITDIVAEINAGKEASIFVAHLNQAPIIVKAFRHQNTSHNKQKRRKAGNAQTRAASYAIQEYSFLLKAFQAKARVPTPAMCINNIIIMSFIGSNWQPAPQLRKASLVDPEEMLDKIIEQMKVLYQQAKIIHGDLSEYNILIYNGNPTIIDFPQATDMSLLRNYSDNRMKANLNMLQKDIYTVCHYFEKEYFIETDFEKIFQYVAGKDAFRERVDFTTSELDEILEKQNSNISKNDLDL